MAIQQNTVTPDTVRSAAAEPAPLTSAQVAIIKATAPLLKEHATAVTTQMYKTLLGDHPELKSIFSLRSQTTGAQPRALAESVIAYATHIDNLIALGPAVERIAQKHVSLDIQADQYPIVGQYLLAALAHVLGTDVFCGDVKDAWAAAYGFLANIFVKREAQLYNEATETDGGWTGWRSFKVVRTEPVTDVITNFYLAPSDGGHVARYLPGQYVSVRVPIPQVPGLLQPRQYSLSDAPGSSHAQQQYRISVKREHTLPAPLDPADVAAGRVPGLVSNLLLDHHSQPGSTIELSQPRGEFFVDPADTARAAAPLVLISSGVGAAPLYSILRATKGSAAVAAAHSARPTTWIHVAGTPARACFADEARALLSQNCDDLSVRVFVRTLPEGSNDGVELAAAEAGAAGVDWAKLGVEAFLDRQDAEYFVCGREEWMVSVRDELLARGVERGRIAMELFRTGTVG